MRFYGRDGLIRQLQNLWGKQVSSFVTCRGRRRIGKSTLIARFAALSEARFIRIEGVKPNEMTTDKDERAYFATQLAEQTGAESSCPSNWLNALIRLSKEIRDDQRTVVLLDEVSWMAHFDRMFSGTLKIAWDNYLKPHDKLIFVVCGSVSSWIKEEIIDNRAFYGRRSADIVVPELPLCECAKFWGEASDRVATKEMLDVLSVTGGVPRYLEEVNPSLSASENLRRMCFLPNAPLRVDFDEMFTDVITRQQRLCAKILRCLVDGAHTITEIASDTKVEKGGDISKALSQLAECGMVSSDIGKNPETGAVIREKRYRLRDNYSRFYLKYIEPNKATIDSGGYVFTGLDQFAGWDAIMGLQFENLVVNNYRDILAPLHLENVIVNSAAPFMQKATKAKGKGLQIDLLVQTNMSICVVEIKRRAHIGREIIDEVKEKCHRLRHQSGVSVRTALVFDGELVRSVEADGFFDAIVPIRSLLQIP